MITTSKLNNGIVFSLAIFWGPRAEGLGVEDKGRGSRKTNTQKYLVFFWEDKERQEEIKTER